MVPDEPTDGREWWLDLSERDVELLVRATQLFAMKSIGGPEFQAAEELHAHVRKLSDLIQQFWDTHVRGSE